MTTMCPKCRRKLPEEVIDEIIERAQHFQAKNEDMLVTLECPCGFAFRFAMDTNTMEPYELPAGFESGGGGNVH